VAAKALKRHKKELHSGFLRAKTYSLTATTTGTCENSLRKIGRFCRKTGVSAKENAAFANDFSLFHEFQIRYSLCHNRIWRGALLQKIMLKYLP
jgi:hypothetical protein